MSVSEINHLSLPPIDLTQIQNCPESREEKIKKEPSPVYQNNLLLLSFSYPQVQWSSQDLCRKDGNLFFYSDKIPQLTPEQKKLGEAREDYSALALRLAKHRDEYVDALIVEEKRRQGIDSHSGAADAFLAFFGSLLGVGVTFGIGTEVTKDLFQSFHASRVIPDISHPPERMRGFYYENEKAAAKERIKKGIEPCLLEKVISDKNIWSAVYDRLIRGLIAGLVVTIKAFEWKAQEQLRFEEKIQKLIENSAGEKTSSEKRKATDFSWEGKSLHQLEVEMEQMRTADHLLIQDLLKVYEKILTLKLTELQKGSLEQIQNLEVFQKAQEVIKQELATDSSWIAQAGALAGSLGIGTVLGFGAVAPFTKYLYDKRMELWRESFQKKLHLIKERAIQDARDEMGLRCETKREDSDIPSSSSKMNQIEFLQWAGVEGEIKNSTFENSPYLPFKHWKSIFQHKLELEISHRFLFFWGSKIDSKREAHLKERLKDFQTALDQGDLERTKQIQEKLEFLWSFYQEFESKSNENNRLFATRWPLVSLAAGTVGAIGWTAVSAMGATGGVGGKAILGATTNVANDNAFVLAASFLVFLNF